MKILFKRVNFYLSILVTTSLLLAQIPFSFVTPEVAEAAPPPEPENVIKLLAAGERSVILQTTTDNNTKNHNGSEWYYKTTYGSIGFAQAGDTVLLYSADVNNTNPEYRLSWHVYTFGSDLYLDSGYRLGEEDGLNYSTDHSRYIYHANTLPAYYPSGPQLNVDFDDLDGWSLCYTDTYADSNPIEAIWTSCDGQYLLFAGSSNPYNKIDVELSGTSILNTPGGTQSNLQIYTGNTLSLKLYETDSVTDMNWDHYKIFVSDCSIYDCSTPDLPTDDPGEWDLGTLVTNGSYTIPNPAEGKYLAIYAADDDNGDPVTIGGSYTIIAVKNTPATYNVTDCEELQAISDGHLEDNVYLLNDIDCSETFEWNAGAGFEPIGNNSDQFFGKFFGNGYTISDLTINRPGADYIGLFGVLGDGGELQNFTLDNVNIVGDDSVGAAVGYLGGTMNNVHSSGEIRGYYNIGGLVGEHAEPLGTGSSGVLLYTWDGSDYTYMHDVGRGMPRNVVGDDYVQVDSSKLQPKDGKYSLKMAQEYNEIPFYDEAKLITFDHEPGYNIVTTPIRNNEGNFISIADNPSHPLQACTDKYGNNCLDDLASDDDKWSYKHDSNINYWDLDFGDLSGASRIMLILRGAIDYTLDADSLRLVQVKNSVGEWVNAYTSSQISSLGGSPRLQAIDLTGKFVSDNYEVRIGYDRTRINYFAVDTSAPVTYEMTELHPETANLGFRGYSEVNREYYWDHNYNNVSDQPLEPYAPQFGWFTKYGDVAQLLSSTNDQFVIMHHGDVIDMEFEYNPVEDGKERSFIFYNWIIYKHAKSGSYGQTVEPLPFKGMSKYPYTSPETYPFTPVNVSYLREWNTRFIQGSFSNNSSTVLNSSSSADVYGEEIVGGLVGYNEKLVDLSFATGNVYAEDSSYSHAGGLVGFNDDDGTVSRSYATGNVTGDSDFGGFAGYFGGYEDEVIEFSFWDIQTADVTDACGNTDCESDAVAKNTTEMKALATFTTELGANSWDFEDIWAINAAYNDSYPFFIWAIPQDSDNDGILDQVEDDGPNSGDANNDGTPDSEQEHVSSFYNEVSSAYSVLEAPNTCTISSVTAQAEASLSVSDSGYSYPAGLLNFTIDCGTPGFTAEIKIYHYGELGSDFVLRKHNTNNNSFTTISEATFSQATIDGQPVNVVTYSITDGSSLDLDDELNGIIVDPVGYGISDLGAPVTGFGGRHNR